MSAMVAHPQRSAAPRLDAIPVGWLGEPRLLAGITRRSLTDYAEHVAQHGPPRLLTRDALISLADAVGLHGRGGAAFPVATKLRALRNGGRPVVVVNGCEGEPSSSKDTVLLSRTPQLVLDGAGATAAAIGARTVIVAVTDPRLASVVRAAVAGRPDSELFTVRELADRFVSGEARAVISALNGGQALPPGRRIQPTERGVDGQPTLLSNAETFAQLAILVRRGPVGYGAGTSLITVTGAVQRPGVLEVGPEITLGDVAAATGAYPSQAVIIGGFHGRWHAPDLALRLSHAELARLGGTFGAGAVMFLGEQSCGLAELARVTGWLASQSARQCGPCAFGLPALHADVLALRDPQSGRGGHAADRSSDAALRHAALIRGRGACAHPDGAAGFVTSGLAALTEDIRLHQTYGDCRRSDLGHLPMIREQAFTRSPSSAAWNGGSV